MAAKGLPPTVRRRRLAAELRQLRDLAELRIEDAADRMGWSLAKQSKIETARVGITVNDVKKMLDAYAVESDDKRALVLGLARHARKKGWWDAYADSLPSDYQSYIELEQEAAALRCYDAVTLHGLLQTEAYAREIIRASLMGLSSPKEVERRVEVRLARQRRLRRKELPGKSQDAKPPQETTLRFWAVIDESVLDRVVGSPELMKEQYEQLLDLAERDNITIQIVPSAVGAHAGAAGKFSLMEFPEPHDPDVVYVETLTSNLYVENDAEVYRYALAFDYLGAAALGPAESRDHIARRLEPTL